jgi:hypothetical protein
MPRLMIMCPDTKKLIPTGLSMDKHSFDASTLEDNTVRCPACGKDHTWSKSDVVFEDTKPS